MRTETCSHTVDCVVISKTSEPNSDSVCLSISVRSTATSVSQFSVSSEKSVACRFESFKIIITVNWQQLLSETNMRQRLWVRWKFTDSVAHPLDTLIFAVIWFCFRLLKKCWTISFYFHYIYGLGHPFRAQMINTESRMSAANALEKEHKLYERENAQKRINESATIVSWPYRTKMFAHLFSALNVTHSVLDHCLSLYCAHATIKSMLFHLWAARLFIFHVKFMQNKNIKAKRNSDIVNSVDIASETEMDLWKCHQFISFLMLRSLHAGEYTKHTPHESHTHPNRNDHFHLLCEEVCQMSVYSLPFSLRALNVGDCKCESESVSVAMSFCWQWNE